MGVQNSKRYLALTEGSEKLRSAGWKLVRQSDRSFKKLSLFQLRVCAPTNDSLEASARFEVHKIDEGRIRVLRSQFTANNSEGDRVVLRCRDGTVAPHQEILRSAWSGFLDGGSSFRIDFKEYRLQDIRNLIWFIYTSRLPDEDYELLSLLSTSHRLGYTSLSEAGAKELLDKCADLDEASVQKLIRYARRFELKSLYDRICVVLARNFQRRELMHSLDVDILRDVLTQDCLAVFSEDEVGAFVEEYADRNGGDIPLSFARCIRYKFLKAPISERLLFNKIFQDNFAQPRDSFEPFYIRARAGFRHRNDTLTIKLKIELETPDGRNKKLCALKQHSNNLHETKSDFEFPVAIVSCRMNLFAQLGKSVVQIDPSGHACSVVCHDVIGLETSEEPRQVVAVTKLNQKIILCDGPAEVLQSFCIRPSVDGFDLAVFLRSESGNIKDLLANEVISEREKLIAE
ncbi:uncharacterized protein LOC108865204 [Galendromus occidentalis]|uniref:Uncharacterized protein LOC108865204 n=1 Tax=Galendromus occidentalis TaxID=34638 RepID=A0AAJ7PBK8_9ACAR|nr:uncharacterized protein LOC108865204 [Galendromus occidentalis]